jgi:cytochrome b561
VRGDSYFGLFTVPAFDPGNKALRENVEDLHGTIATIILVLAGLHASAGLLHYYLWHDGVLRRMLPGAN